MQRYKGTCMFQIVFFQSVMILVIINVLENIAYDS